MLETLLRKNYSELNLAKAEMCLDEASRIIYRQLEATMDQIEFKQILIEIKIMTLAGLDDDKLADNLTNYFADFLRDGFVQATLDLDKLGEIYPSIYIKLTHLFKLAKQFYFNQRGEGAEVSLMGPEPWGKI